MKTYSYARPARLTAVALTVLAAGCASFGSNGPPPAAISSGAKPVPMVQNCGVLNTGTPSRFVCDGKVYTSFQLAKLREDEAKKYASGK
jgi:hypothetical protein